MICGRCGQLTASHSTYCPRDKWSLWQAAPEQDGQVVTELKGLQLPRGVGGFLARRRDESRHAHLEKDVRHQVDARVERLEAHVESHPDDDLAQSELGLVSLLNENWARANAHFGRARALRPQDVAVMVNHAAVLAHSGKWALAIEVLEAARKLEPHHPVVLFDLALAAVGAHRSQLALEALDTLQAAWRDDAALAQEYWSDALSARGLALLQLNCVPEARIAFEAALRPALSMLSNARLAQPALATVGANGLQAGSGTQVGSGTQAGSGTQVDSAHHDGAQGNGAHRDENANGASTPDGESSSFWRLGERRRADRRVKNAPELIPAGVDRRIALRRQKLAAGNAVGAGEEDASTTASNGFSDGSDNGGESGSANGAPNGAPNGFVPGDAQSRAELLVNLALVEAREGENTAAIGHLAAALRLAPGHPRALNNLGVLAYRQNEFGAALRFLELAHQMEEAEGQSTPQVLSHLGITLAATGQFSEGMEVLARAGGQEHAEFMVFFNTGRAYIAHGKPERGIEFLRHAFAVSPNHPDVYAVMGAAYLFNGRANVLPQATQQLRRTLQISPKHRPALADLSMSLREEGAQDASREALEAAVKTTPRGAETLFLLGLALMRIGDEVHWAQASKVFESARHANGEFPAALYNSALCQHLMGMRDTTETLLSEVVRADPTFGPAYYMIGIGHAADKHYADALAAWKTAEKYEPDNPDLQANIAYIYYRRGDYPSAIKHFSAAHRIVPNETTFLIALGVAYARSQVEKALPKAIECFKRALEINELLPVAHMNLGLAYYLHTMPEVAVSHWRRVSQLDSDYYKRIEEQEMATGKRSYDDTLIQLRPLNWPSRVVGLAPVLPPSHTELLPGDNVRHFRLLIDDPKLAKLHEMQRELRRLNRVLEWSNTK